MKFKVIFLVIPVMLSANMARAAVSNPNEPATRGYVYNSAVATRTANEQFATQAIASAALALEQYIDDALAGKADKNTTYTKAEVDAAIADIDVGGFECTGTDGQYLAQINDGVTTCVPIVTTGDTFIE